MLTEIINLRSQSKDRKKKKRGGLYFHNTIQIHLIVLHIYLLKQKKEENVNVAYIFEKKHILLKNMQKILYSTRFIVIIGLNKLTQIIELIVQSENLRMSPTVHDEFKSFNFKHERRYLYELVGRKVLQDLL